jgi:general stress protein 26
MTKREEALAFLKSRSTGVLATIASDGMPRARLVYFACDDEFNVYFITFANTRKAFDIRMHPVAAFVVAEEGTPKTLQLEGSVADLTETATIDPTLSELVERLMSNKEYGAPLMRFDSSKLRFYKLMPKWLRWGDFTEGHTTDEVLTELHP